MAMPIKYQMRITETRMKTFETISYSAEEAKQKIIQQYNKKEIDLNSEDYIMSPIELNIQKAWPAEMNNLCFVGHST